VKQSVSRIPCAQKGEQQERERERDVHHGGKLNNENYCAIITKII
jgi:hypothetical protein